MRNFIRSGLVSTILLTVSVVDSCVADSVLLHPGFDEGTHLA